MRRAGQSIRAMGTVQRLTIDSKALAHNKLGDPARRVIDLYLPADYRPGESLPLLVDLAGYTGSGLSHTNWRAFTENVPERADRLIDQGKMPRVAIAFPDCYTRLGGNQYVNSVVMGLWEDFLCEEMLQFIEGKFPGLGGAGRRGIFGKSSGGYGAIVHAMRHADIWAAAACHSGDMAFELCHLSDMPSVMTEFSRYGYSVKKFMDALEASDKPTDKMTHLVMMMGQAASYDPDPSQYLGIRLPVIPETCDIIPERWENWLRHDPLMMVDGLYENLKSLKALYIDCGDRDQFHLHFGARRLHRKLNDMGVSHRYEEFPDDHSSVDYRMDHSLPYLAKALS